MALPQEIPQRLDLMGMAQTAAGNLVIGSTSRFVGLDRAPTMAGIRYVLDSARRIAPAIGQLRMLRTWAGFRPYTPDGLPLLGPAAGVDGLALVLLRRHVRQRAHHRPQPGQGLDPALARAAGYESRSALSTLKRGFAASQIEAAKLECRAVALPATVL